MNTKGKSLKAAVMIWLFANILSGPLSFLIIRYEILDVFDYLPVDVDDQFILLAFLIFFLLLIVLSSWGIFMLSAGYRYISRKSNWKRFNKVLVAASLSIITSLLTYTPINFLIRFHIIDLRSSSIFPGINFKDGYWDSSVLTAFIPFVIIHFLLSIHYSIKAVEESLSLTNNTIQEDY